MCLDLLCKFVDVDIDIIKDQSVPKARRYTIIVFMVLVALLSVVVLIIDIVWSCRIKWFKYGLWDAKLIYILSIISTILYALVLFFFLLFICVSFCKNGKTRCLFFLFSFTTWVGMIIGIFSFAKATESVEVMFLPKIPCSLSLNASYYGALENLNGEKLDQYLAWYANHDPICEKILTPALLAEIIQFVFYLVMLSVITGCCCCNKEKKRKIVNETSENKAPINDPPNQNNQNEAKNNYVDL
ncbi:hypothetical protein M9Y10_032223 [Tritrichomonas musculus]|uniref:Tetraspanin family protein n=1 Tax=Tritrichomonas musculus TaxID=1915356 RepID=A0ABR2GZH1_9EUKA